MKNIIYIIALVLCLFTVAAKEDGSAASVKVRQDRFEFYGNVSPCLDTMVIRWDVDDVFGSPDTSIIYDYPECFDSRNRRILPLYNRLLNHLGNVFGFSVWHNIDGSDEDLIIFFQKDFSFEDRYDTVFWAIRCAPEEVDSVLSLYAEE